MITSQFRPQTVIILFEQIIEEIGDVDISSGLIQNLSFRRNGSVDARRAVQNCQRNVGDGSNLQRSPVKMFNWKTETNVSKTWMQVQFIF